MKEQVIARRSVDILSRLLAEENIVIVHDPKAKTASFFPKERKLIFPTFGNTISMTAQVSLALHETGHATDTPESVLPLFKKYGKSVVNILEDVRIEKKVKRKFPGSSKFFVRGYDELVVEHNFFGTAASANPYDFSHFGFLDRVNVHFKLGAKAMVPFNAEEQALVDEIAEIETLDDLERLAAKLKEIAKENAKNEQPLGEMPELPDFDPEDFDPEDFEESYEPAPSDDSEEEDDSDESEVAESSDSEANDDEGDAGEGDDDSDTESDEGEESESASSGDDSESDEGEESEGDGDADSDDESEEGEGDSASGGSESDDSDDTSDSDSSGSGEASDESSDDADDSDDESEARKGGKDKASDSDDAGSNETGTDENAGIDITEDDLEQSETDAAAEKALSDLIEKAGSVTSIPKTKDIPNIVQSWKLIESKVDKLLAVGDSYNDRSAESLNRFRLEIKPVVNKMVAEFNRNAAGAVSRRTSYKDTGSLDPRMMVHYKYKDSIFKRRKYVRDGKNHGVILYLDMSSSMSGNRITSIVRQALTMVEFCRKINLPFRVYGWANRYFDSSTEAKPKFCYKHIDPDASASWSSDIVGITEMLSSDMPKDKLEKFERWMLTTRGMAYGGTPLARTLFAAMPEIAKFRKEAGVDIMNMMILSDGESSDTFKGFGGGTMIDDETGTVYSMEEFNNEFYSDSFTQPGGAYYVSEYSRECNYKLERQMYFYSKILKDRYNVSLNYLFMNARFKKTMYGKIPYGFASTLHYRLNSGQWSDAEIEAARNALASGMKLAKVGTRGTFTLLMIEDGYDLSTRDLNLKINKDSSKAAIQREFSRGMMNRKAATVFATLVAESIAS